MFEIINIDEIKKKFVDTNCEFTLCINRKNCIKEGFLCPAICQFNAGVRYTVQE